MNNITVKLNSFVTDSILRATNKVLAMHFPLCKVLLQPIFGGFSKGSSGNPFTANNRFHIREKCKCLRNCISVDILAFFSHLIKYMTLATPQTPYGLWPVSSQLKISWALLVFFAPRTSVAAGSTSAQCVNPVKFLKTQQLFGPIVDKSFLTFKYQVLGMRVIINGGRRARKLLNFSHLFLTDLNSSCLPRDEEKAEKCWDI